MYYWLHVNEFVMIDVEKTLRQLHHMIIASTMLQLTLKIAKLYISLVKHLQQRASQLRHIYWLKRSLNEAMVDLFKYYGKPT